MQISNPVLPGFNADPSIIRVGDTYYIANSTFEWFPGVRIHESKDLVNWHLITHPLSTVEHLDMKGNPDSGGIWAPDLSYADGKFWLIFTDVKITDGPFKDMHNYLTTATDIRGPWSKPIELNGVGFDASLFHDNDGKKYLVQQTWDHREYRHPFDGITLTEFNVETMKLMPETARTVYDGTDVKLVEGPHLYQKEGYYYIFAAQGGTVFTHQEVVGRSKTLDAHSFETQPGDVFLTNFDTPDSYLQKQGHGALVDTPDGEWYYASLTGRPWHHPNESATDPRGWSTLGRETAIQKVEWDQEGWPHIVGGHGGQRYVEAPKGVQECKWPATYPEKDDFDSPELNINFNTLRIPFTDEIGSLTERPGFLRLYGRETLGSTFTQAHVARRWQSFNFDVETKVDFKPFSYQQAAGLTNYYNTKHFSMIEVTWDEKRATRVIEVIENNRNNLTSFLKDDAIVVPEDVQSVYLKAKIRKQSYSYAYSFDGENWLDLPVILDAAILSDDYVLQTMGGFFTGAFTGMAAVDYSGYRLPADFDYFKYTERKDLDGK
ncbi:glycoside hydrolase 43 family protein [Latilactobacillus curvatus]|uniref:Glycoside hydrolase 43 family protein n=1 Tax=Latilactobacillus curvatus TaxID=28038 RepID=A0AAC9UNH4_LATCU|nr:glycoside hydrolase family 43 protein [Latilactobacillus curvatus]ASN60343.1 glycoside hydrolase 43 family protein [Latilactobacillus curvatus]